MQKIPGPGISQAIGNVFRFARNPLMFMKQMQQRYGDFIQIWMGPKRFFLTFHPKYTQHILQTHQKNYLHSRLIFDKLIPLTGATGLVQLEGTAWKQHRRITNASFKPSQLETFVPIIIEITKQYLKDIPQNQPIEICQEMTDLILKTAMRMLFSLEAESQVSQISQAFLQANRCCGNRIKSIVHVPNLIPSPNNIRFSKAVKKLDEFAYATIAERQQQQNLGNDMLATLMEAENEETGEKIGDVQLRDHMMTFLFAGHETTACSLAWCFYLISQHPEVEQKMREEIANVVAGRNLQYADIAQLRYVSMVYQEALRLYPPAWILARQPVGPDTIDGYKIPKNCDILLNIWEIHRHPEFWENPESFIPERFSDAKPHHFAYLPFGAGPRICSGARLSMLEGVVILAMFLQQYKLNLVPQQNIEVETTITARPRYGIMMELKPHA